MNFQDYISREEFKGTALEWLKQEYARQDRLKVKTFEKLEFIPGIRDETRDTMVPLGAFEINY